MHNIPFTSYHVCAKVQGGGRGGGGGGTPHLDVQEMTSPMCVETVRHISVADNVCRRTPPSIILWNQTTQSSMVVRHTTHGRYEPQQAVVRKRRESVSCNLSVYILVLPCFRTSTKYNNFHMTSSTVSNLELSSVSFPGLPRRSKHLHWQLLMLGNIHIALHPVSLHYIFHLRLSLCDLPLGMRKLAHWILTVKATGKPSRLKLRGQQLGAALQVT